MSEKDQHSRLSAIIETAIDGIITIDSRGTIESMNPAAAKLFGYQPAEVIGQNIKVLMPDPDRSAHDGYIQHYLTTGEERIIGIGREVSGLKKDGTIFPFRLAISEVKLEAGQRIFTGIIHDLTESKRNELRLRQYAEELERSNRELENFAYISSHDLQEPLRKIRAFGSRIETKEAPQLTEKGKDYLQRMLNASARMQNLINDLLVFSRVSSQAKPYESVDLNQVLAEVVSDLEIAIQQSGAELTLASLPHIQAEPLQMRQLLQNLISNAIKFREPERAVKITVDWQPDPEAPDPQTGKIQLRVHDNGIGFEEKYLDRIFNIFQRLEGRKYEGSGIGLAICRKIAQRHEGDITAQSQPGKGTTFIVTLSRTQSQEMREHFFGKKTAPYDGDEREKSA